MPPLAYQLLDAQMGGGLAEFIADRRADTLSFNRIAHELSDHTGVLITAETVRRWADQQVAA